MDKAFFLAEGIFTDEMRRKLRNKRIQLGLTYFRLGNFLNINWSTIRKWEKGLAASCRYNQRAKFWDFINGEYDQALRLTNSNADYSFRSGLPTNIQMCMEKLTNTYMICRNLDDLQKDLLRNVDRITSEILTEMLEGPSGVDSDNEDYSTSNQNDEYLLEETRELDSFLNAHY